MAKEIVDLFADLDRITQVKNRNEIYQPAFMYIGGKYRFAEKILEHLPMTDRYCEPFAGSLAILLNRPKVKMEVVNDTHQGVTNFYRVLRSKEMFGQLKDWLTLTVHSRADWLQFKDSWANVDDPIEKAGRWYYTHTYSFGSKEQSFGRATGVNCVLAGRISKYLPMFDRIHKRLESVQIECIDYLDMFDEYDHEDMVWYIDPPYLHTDTGIYGKIDHRELLDRVFRLKGFAAVSGEPHPWYDERPWSDRFEFDAHNSLRAQAFTDGNHKDDSDYGRPSRKEVLWLKK